MDRLTVLLAEDMKPIRQLLGYSLRRAGYEVLEASNGTDALHTALQYPGAIHVVVSDVIMPGMNGIDLAKSVKVKRPTVKIVLISGYSRRAIEADCDGFLQKPFLPNALTECIRKVLAPAEARPLSLTQLAQPAH
jgi:two-component system, cell cycle sensor histidine kinase and response regulator CckA